MATDGAMVIVAHPDDAEFLAGGTAALWARDGVEVIYVIVTRGDKGSEDPELTSDQLAEIRREEQEAAAKSLGVSKVLFLGYEDGVLEPSLELRRDLVRVIRTHTPKIVVTFDPSPRFIMENYPNHPDHRAAGSAALDAVFPAARDRLTFPELLEEGLAPHKVREIWLGGAADVNHWVDIEPVLEDKISALRKHASQLSDFPLEEAIPEMAKQLAEGSPHTFAESFRRAVLD
ncbi:MAG: PIG-L family deacetylase [Chloroflexi bacterium]|nr:PIG-L family deacetylase [Chloroflexota bacterium]